MTVLEEVGNRKLLKKEKNMDFVLNEYHRNISDEDLINDVLRVAKLCDTNILSRSTYEKYGKYGSTTMSRRFGSWNKALGKAGLSVYCQEWGKHQQCENDEDFFADMRRIASQLQKTYITSGEYKQYGLYNCSSMSRRFGSWNVILEKAGLSPTPFRLGKGKEISDEELFQDIERVWIKLGRQPTVTDVKNGEFSFGQNTFVRRFGGWRGTLEAFVRYINSEEKTTPTNDEIEDKSNIEASLPRKDSSHKSNRNTSRDINLRLRFKVMQRDNFKCCICGKSPATSPNVTLHIDHIKPWSKGGETTIDNLQTLCSDCNLGKSDLYDE
jgi:hypothetical protein